MSGSRRTCEICGIRERFSADKLFFARFPSSEKVCKEWVKLVGKQDLVYLPIEKLHSLRFVCEKHFGKRDFTKTRTRLKKHAVPKHQLTMTPLTEEQMIGFPFHMAKSQMKDEPVASTSQSSFLSVAISGNLKEHGYADATPRKRKLLQELRKTNCTLSSLKKSAQLLESLSSPVLKEIVMAALKNSSKATQNQPKPTESKVPKPTESEVPKPTESKVPKPTESKVPKPTESEVPKPTESDCVEEQAIDAEITGEEEYLETFDDDLGHEVEEQHVREGPFSWQKHTEEIVALDENVPADDDVIFCSEAQLVPDSSEPVSQTQEEYSCNACNHRITGVRYVCVVCPDWDLCGACEALQHHAQHYVLRVPHGKPASETAWVIATLRQMLASREGPDIPVVKEEVKSEDPLADVDVPFEAREDDAQTRDLDTDSIEDTVEERIDTDRTSDLPSTPQKRSTTAHSEAIPAKKQKHVVLKAVSIQRKDIITGNVVILGKHKTDNSQDIVTGTTQKKHHNISIGDLKMHIPQKETSKVTMWDDVRKQKVTATIQKPKLQNETGTVISVDDLRKRTVPVLKQTSQQDTGKVFTLDDIMKKINVVDKKQKITVIAAPVKKNVSQIGADKIIFQKGVISLMKPTHVVDNPNIIATAGPGKKTSHVESDTISLSKKILTLKKPERVTVSEKITPESGETILLDDTISDIVQPTGSGVTESPAASWDTVQVLETSSGGSMILKVLENPRQLCVNMTRLSNDDIQNATQPSTSKR